MRRIVLQVGEMDEINVEVVEDVWACIINVSGVCHLKLRKSSTNQLYTTW